MTPSKMKSDFLMPYPKAADRLHYATGQLLGPDDFCLEQTYHRRQLARALLYLHGSGTIAGLKVIVKHLPAAQPEDVDVEIEVLPGLALDRAGRLIEVSRKYCLRLRRWYDFIALRKLVPKEVNEYDVDDLRGAFRPKPGEQTGTVVADVFLAFHACDRGYTPAFASGPFDAIDASQPSRIRDAHELSLIIRDKTDKLADLTGDKNDPWSEVTSANLAQTIFDSWDKRKVPEPDDTAGHGERPAGVDPTAVLLARLELPVKKPDATHAPDPDWTAGTWPANDSNIDNSVRLFVVPPAALRHLI
jgi:hypothetical protein